MDIFGAPKSNLRGVGGEKGALIKVLISTVIDFVGCHSCPHNRHLLIHHRNSPIDLAFFRALDFRFPDEATTIFQFLKWGDVMDTTYPTGLLV